MEDDLLKSLLERFEYLSERASADCPAVNCPADKLGEFMRRMRDEDFDMLADVTAIDWGEDCPRFTCVYHLFSTGKHYYIRVAADCLDDVEPEMQSLCEIWPAANWHERETYDMFGIRFTGHPDLKRILMWEGYPYYPLRKEFPLAGIEVDFPAADVAEATQEKVRPAPMMGGPFNSSQAGHMSQREPRAKDESWTEQSEKPLK